MATFNPGSVADRLEIRELIDRYNDAVNHRDWPALTALFAPDAIWEVGPPVNLRFEGAGKIVAGIRWSVGRMEVLVQSSSAVVIDLLGPQRATARSTLVEFGRPAGAGTIEGAAGGMHAAGTYYDELIKPDGVWRFRQRLLRVRYTDEVSVPGQVHENLPPGTATMPPSMRPPAPPDAARGMR